MSFSWWRNLASWASKHNQSSKSRGKRAGKRRPSSRPAVEQLEDRLVPSTVSVNIPTNLTVARGGVVTVPINVSSLAADDGFGDVEEGIDGANFIVNYNPAIFQQVTASNVFIGTISTGGLTDANDGFKPATNPATTAGTNGWVVKPTFPTPGQIALRTG